MKFSALEIGQKFMLNGNYCTKKSSRTAWIDGNKKELWFYFGLSEYVKLGWF